MKNNHRETSFSSNEKILGGIVLGTLIGVAGAFLYATKAGHDVRENLAETYHTARNKIHDLSDMVVDKSDKIIHSKKNSTTPLNFLIGGIAGSLIGMTAAAFLRGNTKSVGTNILHSFKTFADKADDFLEDTQENVHGVLDTCEDKVSCWINTAKKLIDNINKIADETDEKVHHQSQTESHSTIDKFIDLATIGVQLYQSLKK